MTDTRTCKHCKATAEQLGPIGMWQHCPEHEGGSLTHEWTDPSLPSQASEEAAMALRIARRVRSEPCRCPQEPDQDADQCEGCIGRIAAEEIGGALDRVSRERTRQALERAAKVAEDFAAKHRTSAPLSSHTVVEHSACATANEVATLIRALLSDGESVASEEKEE